jgi:hypothetical protein
VVNLQEPTREHWWADVLADPARETTPGFAWLHSRTAKNATCLPDYLPENGEDSRSGEAYRITLAVVDLSNNVQGEFSAHRFAASELKRKSFACTIECVGHDAEGVGIVDTPDTARRGHLALYSSRKCAAQITTKCVRSPRVPLEFSSNRLCADLFGIDSSIINLSINSFFFRQRIGFFLAIRVHRVPSDGTSSSRDCLS